MRVSKLSSNSTIRDTGLCLRCMVASVFAGSYMLVGNASAASSMHAEVYSINPNRIEVLSNGVAYTQTAIPLVSLSAGMLVDIDSLFTGSVKSWKVWINASPQAPGHAGANVHFTQHAYSESYPVGSRPKKV